ncbi:MAG: hypothetical protein LIO51_08290 [Clostridiales bacterium]|nr:hypothetical protein [Clostridiales bacterium]
MNSLKKISALVLSLLLCAALLAGCSSGSSDSASDSDSGIITVYSSPDDVVVDDSDLTPLAEVTDFTFDFESLDYSFTGAEGADFYYIRVYPVTDGEEGNSASFQSDKINADDTNSYSGTIADETLLAGDYIAYVVASGDGYSSSETSVTGSSTLMASASLSANWNTGDGEDGDGTVSVDITITPGDDIAQTFTLIVTNEAGEEVYRDESATSDPINLTAADLGADELTVEDVYNVTVTVNQVSGYTAPAEGATAQVTEAMSFGFPG